MRGTSTDVTTLRASSAGAAPRCLVGLDSGWIPIGDEVQANAVFEQRLQPGEHQREALGRVGDLLGEGIAVAGEAGCS